MYLVQEIETRKVAVTRR